MPRRTALNRNSTLERPIAGSLTREKKERRHPSYTLHVTMIGLGIDVSAKGSRLRNTHQSAALGGHAKIMQLLIERLSTSRQSIIPCPPLLQNATSSQSRWPGY